MSRLILIMMVIKRLKYSMIGVGEDSGGEFEFRSSHLRCPVSID
jgi:hypothetical protein